MKRLETIAIKMILYIIFFSLAIQLEAVVKWFMDMSDMTFAMILMSVVMLVDKGWELCHAK